MAHDELSPLTDRMFWIVMDPRECITENCSRLLEGHAVLPQVLRGLPRIPREMQALRILHAKHMQSGNDAFRSAAIGRSAGTPSGLAELNTLARPRRIAHRSYAREICLKLDCVRLTDDHSAATCLHVPAARRAASR